jgi:hypothetical protein
MYRCLLRPRSPGGNGTGVGPVQGSVTFLTASRGARFIALLAAGAAISLAGCEASGDPAPATVAVPPAQKTEQTVQVQQTIEYGGVKVDIPSAWQRLDTTGCEFHFERWAPPATGHCAYERGIAFYRSATFDPKHGPGVKKGDGAARWAGYVYAGDYAVYAAGDDREIVQGMLDSVRAK